MPLMRSPRLSEDLDACRTGYSVPRTPPRRSRLAPCALEAFRLASLPALLRKRFLLSQPSDPLQRPRWALPALSTSPAEAEVEGGSGSSLEVSRPLSVRESADRLFVPVPPGTPPSSTFRTSSRASSPLIPVALFHATDALGVISPSELFPASKPSRLVTGRSPLGVSSVALSSSGRPPRGFRTLAIRLRRWSIASIAGSMLSWVFNRTHGS
jgi:hypothetical protein